VAGDAVSRRVRWALALALVLLAPVGAEYLTGYDSSTGNLPELLGGLLIFVPLYGAPALLIREVARRSGVRWPGILALALAAGVLQAGVWDQSLFSEGYRDIPYWDEMVGPTWIAALGLSGSAALSFLVGHAVWSYGVPIALVEALRPDLAARPWLRWPGLVVTALLYLAAAGLVLSDSLANEEHRASPAQVAGSLAVVAALTLGAFTVGRRGRPPRDAAVPGPVVVGVVGLAAGFGLHVVPETWVGVGMGVALAVGGAAAVARFSRSGRWRARHVAALATSALLGRALVGFLVTPLGDVAPAAKYTHNAVLLVAAALLGWWAMRRTRPREHAAA
jgi:hypothetical protein